MLINNMLINMLINNMLINMLINNMLIRLHINEAMIKVMTLNITQKIALATSEGDQKKP